MQVHIEFELTVSLVFLVEVPKELLIIRHRALPAHVIFITKPRFFPSLATKHPAHTAVLAIRTNACLPHHNPRPCYQGQSFHPVGSQRKIRRVDVGQ